MTPLHFERLYGADWDELENLLKQIRGKPTRNKPPAVQGERIAELYRRTCEQLALSARAYPAYLIDRLEHMTAEAHQAIYQQHEVGWQRLAALASVGFPRAVRAHATYVWIATAVFVIPALVLGVLVYLRPEFILSLVSPESAADFERMYSDAAQSIGRTRTAQTDWTMFGHYIQHNTGLAFQCFGSGLIAGVGSLFFLAYNGAIIGGIAGYLTERGLASTFYSFVVTHGAFELTAIVLAGAAGLRIGHAIVMPGRHSRTQALVIAAREAIVIVYGIAVMLLIAAAIEAFWSSATWIPHPMKYAIAAVCWIAVLGYLTLQGRRAD